MVCSFAAATTFVVEVSYDTITVVFNAVVDIEVNAGSPATGQLFQVVVDQLFKNLEVCYAHRFHLWVILAVSKLVLVGVV